MYISKPAKKVSLFFFHVHIQPDHIFIRQTSLFTDHILDENKIKGVMHTVLVQGWGIMFVGDQY